MRSIKAILAIAAAVALMALSAVPALANDWDGSWGHNHRFFDDGFIGFNRCCDDRFFDDDFGFDDCGWRCRHDRDDFFGFQNTCNGPYQTIDLNTGEWIWVSC